MLCLMLQYHLTSFLINFEQRDLQSHFAMDLINYLASPLHSHLNDGIPTC